MNCRQCYFSQSTDSIEVIRCRRYPPMITEAKHHKSGYRITADFPPVNADAWCGEWRPSPQGSMFQPPPGSVPTGSVS